MNLSLKGKLITASVCTVAAMAVVLTTIAVTQLQKETQYSIDARVNGIAKSATSAIDQWLSVRRSIVSSVSPHLSDSNVVPVLKQGEQAGGFDLLYFGT